MPLKFKKNKHTKKRVVRRRRKYVSLSSRSVPSGMPTVKVAKLRYVENLSRISTAGTMNNYLFRANGIFKPNVTGVGHKPMGFDQWKLLFNHYVVLGSKITIKVIPETSAVSPAHCGIYLTDTVTPPYTNPSTLMESRRGTYKALSPNMARAVTVTNTFSCKKFFNVTDVKDNSARFGGTFLEDPYDLAVYDFWYGTVDGSTDTVFIQVLIEYIVIFSEPKDLAASS